MAQRCTVCTHPKRDEINGKLIKQTETLNTIAATYGLGKSSLDRHKLRHLKVSPALVSEARNALTIVGYATDLFERASRIADTAEALLADVRPGDMPSRSVQAAAAALRELRGSIDLLAKLVVSTPDEKPETANSWLDDAISQAVTDLRMAELPGGARSLESGIADAVIVQAPE